MARQPQKKQREVMKQRLANPHLFRQVDVMKKLGIKNSNEYYRMFERSIIADRKREIEVL